MTDSYNILISKEVGTMDIKQLKKTLADNPNIQFDYSMLLKVMNLVGKDETEFLRGYLIAACAGEIFLDRWIEAVFKTRDIELSLEKYIEVKNSEKLNLVDRITRRL